MRRAMTTLLSALLVLALLGLPLAAEAGAKKPVKRAKITQKARKTGKKAGTKAKAKTSSQAQRDVDAVISWLRKHIAEAKKTGKPSDLPTQLLAGLFQLSIPNIVHGQYALASTGLALRSGGMPKDQVQVVAKDMAGNFQRLEQIFANLAKTPALRGPIASFFEAIGAVTAKGHAAAIALSGYAQDPNAQAGASSFQQALEAYRASIKALVQRIQ